MKRGQTALEYLMTYGWALVVIVIVIAALYYFGVFTPPVASTCIGLTEFAYVDHALDADQDLHLQVMGGATDINVTGVKVGAETKVTLTTEIEVKAGTKTMLDFTGAGPAGNSVGDTYQGTDVIVYYNIIGGLQNQTDSATCSGTYQ